MNASCEWAFDPPVPLDPQSSGDERHLIRDAAVAEELAIRYVDAQRGFRSGHYAGEIEYAGMRERCLSSLFEVIADQHGVAVLHSRPLLRQRPLGFETFVVFLPMALLVGAAADDVTRRINLRSWREGCAIRRDVLASLLVSCRITRLHLECSP